MLKKMIVLAVVGFVAVSAISGTKLASYIRSEVRSAREQAEANIPPDAEITRLKNEVKHLDGDIMKLVHHLAKERVDVNQLKDTVDELAAKQGKAKELITARADYIRKAEAASAEGTQQVTFGNRTLSIPAAKAELKEGVRRYEANQKSLATHEALLANRIKIRDNLEKQLEAMKNQKTELAASVDSMESELEMLKLQQVESKYQNDDTRMAKIKEDLRKLKTKIDVKREELKLMPQVLEDAPAKAANGGESVDDILAPLNGQGKKADASKTDKMPLAD